MRTIAVLAVLLAVLGALPDRAQAERYYPWCAWYDEWTYSCGFTTREQCMATISGVGGLCKPNPYSAPSPEPRRRRGY